MSDGSKTNRATLSEPGPIHLDATRLTPRLLLLQSPRSAIGHARLAIVRDRITQRVGDVVESRVDRADRPGVHVRIVVLQSILVHGLKR